jgi:hypothetical protein
MLLFMLHCNIRIVRFIKQLDKTGKLIECNKYSHMKADLLSFKKENIKWQLE